MSDAHKHGHCCGEDNGQSVGIDSVEHLVEHLSEVVSDSTVIVCVGNELCGDDAAGVRVAKALAEKVPWKVYDTQTVPESFIMKIVDSQPDSLVLVDALDFDAPPGSVELFEADMIGGQGPSTHGPAPVAFLEVLKLFHTCRCAVLGIQPEKVEFGDEMVPKVAKAVEMVISAFRQLADQ